MRLCIRDLGEKQHTPRDQRKGVLPVSGQGHRPFCRATPEELAAWISRSWGFSAQAPHEPESQACPCRFHNTADPPHQGNQPPTERPGAQRPRAASKTEVYVCSWACLLLLLPGTSAFRFLSFPMFPNTSCLVRCLRQTERGRRRQRFIARFVHSFIAKLK